MFYFVLWMLLWPLVPTVWLVVYTRLGVTYQPEALRRMSRITAGVYAAVGLLIYVHVWFA